jgi:tripartite-type tricarboxylate transporter receptor subunit TctC
MRIPKLLLLVSLCSLIIFCSAGVPLLSAESNYPTRPIRWIVAWPPGGSTDVIARIVAQNVSAGLHKAVFIDNRGGAAGVIGMKSAVAAKPDGYTFLVSDSGISSVASLYGSLPFDPDKDLLPITMFARVPHLIVVKNDLPVKSISELVSLAKSKPDSINFGSAGSGSPLHLAGELFRVRAGITWQHIPYRGAGPTIAALLAGEVDVASPTLANVVSHINSGKIRALAVMSQTRTPLAPNIPTLSELGVSDAEAFAYYGLSAPVGVAPGILKQTYEACIQALKSPDVIANLQKQGAEPVGNTSDEYGAFIRADMAKWEEVVKAANIPKQDQ